MVRVWNYDLVFTISKESVLLAASLREKESCPFYSTNVHNLKKHRVGDTDCHSKGTAVVGISVDAKLRFQRAIVSQFQSVEVRE